MRRDGGGDVLGITRTSARATSMLSHGMWATIFAMTGAGRLRHRTLARQWRAELAAQGPRVRRDVAAIRHGGLLATVRALPDYRSMDSMLPASARRLISYVQTTKGPLDGMASDGGMYAPYLALPFFWEHLAAGNLREKIAFGGGKVLVVEVAGQTSKQWSPALASRAGEQWESDASVSFLHERHRQADEQGRLRRHLFRCVDDSQRPDDGLVRHVRFSSTANVRGNFLATVVFETSDAAASLMASFSSKQLPERLVSVRVAFDAGIFIGIDARADYNVKFTLQTATQKQKMGMFTIFTIASGMLGDLSHSHAFNTMCWAQYPGEPQQRACQCANARWRPTVLRPTALIQGCARTQATTCWS